MKAKDLVQPSRASQWLGEEMVVSTDAAAVALCVSNLLKFTSNSKKFKIHFCLILFHKRFKVTKLQVILYLK